jgi:short-subunit dehydrogenase
MAELKPVTVITGASAGIGVALAEVFAERGHEIVLIARRAPQLKALADRIAETGKPRPHVLVVDLARSDATVRIADELRQEGLEPEYMVNNAGYGLLGPAAKLDRGEQLAMIDLNMRTTTDLSLRFMESLVRRKGGILNVASVAGFFPAPGMAVYHATKAYVLSFSEALHHEMKGQVRVTALCPGPVETEFQTRAGVPKGYFPNLLSRSAERVAREGYEGLMNGKRVVVPGSANKVLVFLPRILPRTWTLSLSKGGKP